MTPGIHGQELSVGDDLGRTATPDCCDADMTGKTLPDGYREHTCGDCNTVLTVAPSGLIFDITD